MSDNKWQDDLMNNFVIEDEFLAEGDLTEMEQKRILNKVLAAAGQQPEKKRGLSRKSIWTLGLVAVMTLALGSLALAQFSVSRDFFGFFNADERQATVMQQSGQEVMQQVTDNGATLTVEQVLGDKKSMYVLMDFAAPEGTVLDAESYDWQGAVVNLSESIGMGYYFENLPDDDPTDNHTKIMLCLDTERSLSGQTLNLDFSDLRKYDPEKFDYETVVTGNWKLAFKLDYTPQTQEISQTAEIMLGSTRARVTNLEISPFTMALTIETDNPEGFQPLAGYVEPEGGGVAYDADGNEVSYGYWETPVEVRLNDFLGDLDNLTVTLKDGTVLDTQGGGGHSEGNVSQEIFSFNRILNIDEIASIVYCGEELTLK